MREGEKLGTLEKKRIKDKEEKKRGEERGDGKGKQTMFLLAWVSGVYLVYLGKKQTTPLSSPRNPAPSLFLFPLSFTSNNSNTLISIKY